MDSQVKRGRKSLGLCYTFYMKKTLSLLSIILTSGLLTGCFGSGSDTQETSLLIQEYQNFQISIPSSWRKIYQEDFANTIPDETVALFVNRVEGDDFIQNTNVVKESLNTDATSLEYAKANVLLASKALVDYRPVSSSEASISGVETVVHSFRARNATTEPLRYYTQSYFTRDKIGYTVTCVAKDEDLAQQQNCDSIIRSFLLRG